MVRRQKKTIAIEHSAQGEGRGVARAGPRKQQLRTLWTQERLITDKWLGL